MYKTIDFSSFGKQRGEKMKAGTNYKPTLELVDCTLLHGRPTLNFFNIISQTVDKDVSRIFMRSKL